MKVVVASLVLQALSLSAAGDQSCQTSSSSGGCAAKPLAQSLLQLRSRPSKQHLHSGSSEALSGYIQFVESMAAKVAGHNYSMTEAEQTALDTIEKFISQMEETLAAGHREDQNEVDMARDAIQACGTNAQDDLNEVDRYYEIVNRTQDEHGTCRTSEGVCNSERNQLCDDYDHYRMTQPAVPPECLKTLTASLVATKDPEEQARMEECLELTHAWLTPLYAKYLACQRKSDNCTADNDQCDKNQTAYEQAFCTYAMELDHACSEQTRCRNQSITARAIVHEAVAVSEAARKADYETGERILCYFKVFEADNMNKPATLEECRNQIVDTSSFDLVYHAVPAEVECEPVQYRPCDSEWVEAAYAGQPWSTGAPAADCAPCVVAR